MTRNTHNRLLDHEEFDLDTNIQIDGDIGAYLSGTVLHTVLLGFNASIGSGGGGGIIVQDEGTPLTTTATTLNFTGAGVTASGSGATKTIDIPGGSGTTNSYIVRAVATTNGTLSTAFENGDTLSGITLATGDRILLAGQSTASQNGIYTVNASGAPTRATDYNSQAAIRGSIITVWDGFDAFSVWINLNTGSITVGSTNLAFQRLIDIDRLTLLAARTTLLSPNSISDITLLDDLVEIDAIHTPGDLVDLGLYLLIGDDSLSLIVNEKDSSTLQFHGASGSSFNTEFVDQSGSDFISVDEAGVSRGLGTMESRKGSGSATITSGNTSIAVTHGAGYTPNASDIIVTPTNNPTNDPGNFWIDTIGGTTFTINVRSNPGVSGATFAWRVDR